MPRSIEEAEHELESEISRLVANPCSCLHSIVPRDCQPKVSLRDARGRKKRSDASIQCWSAQSGEINIRFPQRPRPDREAPANQVPAGDAAESPMTAEGPRPLPTTPATGGPFAELVQAILAQPQAAAEGFDPAALRGEHLSTTVLRERR